MKKVKMKSVEFSDFFRRWHFDCLLKVQNSENVCIRRVQTFILQIHAPLFALLLVKKDALP